MLVTKEGGQETYWRVRILPRKWSVDMCWLDERETAKIRNVLIVNNNSRRDFKAAKPKSSNLTFSTVIKT